MEALRDSSSDCVPLTLARKHNNSDDIPTGKTARLFMHFVRSRAGHICLVYALYANVKSTRLDGILAYSIVAMKLWAIIYGSIEFH